MLLVRIRASVWPNTKRSVVRKLWILSDSVALFRDAVGFGDYMEVVFAPEEATSGF